MNCTYGHNLPFEHQKRILSDYFGWIAFVHQILPTAGSRIKSKLMTSSYPTLIISLMDLWYNNNEMDLMEWVDESFSSSLQPFLGWLQLCTQRGAVALVSPQTIIWERRRARKRTMALAGNSHDSTGISEERAQKRDLMEKDKEEKEREHCNTL